MKKQRKLVVGFLLLLALVVSGFTYAYWASGVAGANADTDGIDITIGTGDTVTTEVSFGTTTSDLVGKNFVPTAHVGGDEDKTDTVILTFNVNWDGTGTNAGDAATVTRALTAVVNSISIGDDETLNATGGLGDVPMFTAVTQTGVTITGNGTATITVTVTFAVEPKNVDIYNLVAGQILTLNVTFTVAD